MRNMATLEQIEAVRRYMMMKPLGFIGGGNMAEAIVSGLLRKGLTSPPTIRVFDIKTERMEHLKTSLGIEDASSVQDLISSRDVVVMAVKPAQVEPLLKEYKDQLEGKLVISIAAGITLGAMCDVLGKGSKVVRVMPNTPALVLEGVSVISASSQCGPEDIECAKSIFAAVGMCVEMEEKFLNAVTALSGSGPAFCFLFLEALCDGAVRAGLPRDTAMSLAAATMRGAASMVLELKKHPGQLKDMVASPSGTTIEGIAVLESRGFRSAVIDAVSAAFRRAESMSGK
jgi:pyrroline-5-carboxylate reductase